MCLGQSLPPYVGLFACERCCGGEGSRVAGEERNGRGEEAHGFLFLFIFTAAAAAVVVVVAGL